jgi:hypothetical protein
MISSLLNKKNINCLKSGFGFVQKIVDLIVERLKKIEANPPLVSSSPNFSPPLNVLLSPSASPVPTLNVPFTQDLIQGIGGNIFDWFARTVNQMNFWTMK